jgi:hypothetical protein
MIFVAGASMQDDLARGPAPSSGAPTRPRSIPPPRPDPLLRAIQEALRLAEEAEASNLAFILSLCEHEARIAKGCAAGDAPGPEAADFSGA